MGRSSSMKASMMSIIQKILFSAKTAKRPMRALCFSMLRRLIHWTRVAGTQTRGWFMSRLLLLLLLLLLSYGAAQSDKRSPGEGLSSSIQQLRAPRASFSTRKLWKQFRMEAEHRPGGALLTLGPHITPRDINRLIFLRLMNGTKD